MSTKNLQEKSFTPLTASLSYDSLKVTFFPLPAQQERFSAALYSLILSYKQKRKKIISLSGIAKGWSSTKLSTNKRGLNHICNCRHSFGCCMKSLDTILSPGLILLLGLMVTNCPIYQNEMVFCNLASLLLCIHQYMRREKKAKLKANVGNSMIWSWLKGGVMGRCTDTLGTRTWLVSQPFVPLAEQKGVTALALRSSRAGPTHKSPPALASQAQHRPGNGGHTLVHHSLVPSWMQWVSNSTLEVMGCSCHCAAMERKLSRALSCDSACSSFRDWSKQKQVAHAFLHSHVMAQLYMKGTVAVSKLCTAYFRSVNKQFRLSRVKPFMLWRQRDVVPKALMSLWPWHKYLSTSKLKNQSKPYWLYLFFLRLAVIYYWQGISFYWIWDLTPQLVKSENWKLVFFWQCQELGCGIQAMWNYKYQ